ncbi:hypothetical protein ABL78_7706 [Leptomonas seymouri]|uniref:Uncharacterized protein n=1 Tax=Leptomonas seymouri TaxID=5684 RepID=A0A0N1HTM0_LEPSE|nr:hypothetical protein ABL78_7706 [Leptomonas seymouri]|eukprot:KPI83261.1 hypothetical protein ABL78_7706 [Leptomonas seymouri]
MTRICYLCQPPSLPSSYPSSSPVRRPSSAVVSSGRALRMAVARRWRSRLPLPGRSSSPWEAGVDGGAPSSSPQEKWRGRVCAAALTCSGTRRGGAARSRAPCLREIRGGRAVAIHRALYEVPPPPSVLHDDCWTSSRPPCGAAEPSPALVYPASWSLTEGTASVKDAWRQSLVLASLLSLFMRRARTLR